MVDKTPQTLRAALEKLKPWAFAVMEAGDDYALRDRLMELVQEHGGDPCYENGDIVGLAGDDSHALVAWLRRFFNIGDFDYRWSILVNELCYEPFKEKSVRKSFDQGTVRAMFEDGDVGPLLDYFDDHGYDEDAVFWALQDAVLGLGSGTLEACRSACRAYERARDAANEAMWHGAMQHQLVEMGAEATRLWNEWHEVSLEHRKIMDPLFERRDQVVHMWRERHPREKSFDRGTVRAMFEAGERWPLMDYFDDAGTDLATVQAELEIASAESLQAALAELGTLQRETSRLAAEANAVRERSGPHYVEAYRRYKDALAEERAAYEAYRDLVRTYGKRIDWIMQKLDEKGR